MMYFTFSQTAPVSFSEFCIVSTLGNTFSRSVYSWAGAARAVSINSKIF